jgi:hypothetical protein
MPYGRNATTPPRLGSKLDPSDKVVFSVLFTMGTEYGVLRTEYGITEYTPMWSSDRPAMIKVAPAYSVSRRSLCTVSSNSSAGNLNLTYLWTPKASWSALSIPTSKKVSLPRVFPHGS